MSRFRNPLLPIFLTVAADVLGFTFMIPLLPFYGKKFGASPIVSLSLFTVFAVCQFVSGPVLGRISDRIGRKPTLLVSQIGTFAGFLVLGFANSIWMLFLGRILDGVTAGNISIAQAYISDVTTPEKRTRAFSFIGIAFGLSFLIGPAVSSWLAHHAGYGVPPFVAAGLSLTSILCTVFLLPDIKPDKQHQKEDRGSRLDVFTEYFRRTLVRDRLIAFFMFGLSFSLMISGMTLYLAGRFKFNEEQVGYIYAYSGFLGLIIQGVLIGKLVKALGERKLALIGFIAMCIGQASLGYLFHIPPLLVFVAIGGFGSAVLRPSLTALITHSVGKHEQGAVLGVSQSMMSIANMVAPLIAGFFIEHNMFVEYGLTAGVVAAIGALLMMMRDRESSVEPGTELL